MLVIPMATSGYRERLPEPQEVGPAPVPLGAPFALDVAQDLLVYGDGGRVFLVRGMLRGKMETCSLRVSWVSSITAILLHGGVAYVGGRAPFGVLLGLVTLGEKPAWKPIEVPQEAAASAGKGIDGFAIHDGRLIAVDDKIFPWYFLLYDVSSPEAPRPVGVRMFHGHASSVASGHGFLALRQTLASRAGLRRSVRLYDLDTLDERASFEGHTGAPEWVDAPGIPGIAIAEGRLFVAQGEKGLQGINLSALEQGASLRDSTVELRVAEGPVVGVIAADAGRAFAVVRGRAGLDSVLMHY